MDTNRLGSLLCAALVCLSLSGCLAQPGASTLAVTSTPSMISASATPYPLAPVSTARSTHIPTASPTPEWTRAPVKATAAGTAAVEFAGTIEKAKQDLAKRLGLDPGLIQFVQLTPDEFPADTLGCLGPGLTPRPIPATVSGQVIVLEAAGVRYIYHARNEQVVFCGTGG
jgi:hypothetical protein